MIALEPPEHLPAAKPPRFALTLRGVGTVAVHEFRLRLRAGRWRWLLAAWFVVLVVLTATLRAGLVRSGQTVPGTDMFGGLMLFMLALALLVVPALTAQSINGDRERGVLAILQTTLLTPVEIATGKLVAAWGTAVLFLLTSVPLVLWCVSEGASGARALVALTVAAVLLGVVCAVAQCLSALLARSTTSAVMSYLAVFALTVGSVIAFGLALAVTQTTHTAETGGSTFEYTEAHPERVWWLLAPNPFVIVADAAPRLDAPETGTADASFRLDPLAAIGETVRSMREPLVYDAAGNATAVRETPVWPYGLAVNVVVGIAALVLTARRLRTPYARVSRGVRVA